MFFVFVLFFVFLRLVFVSPLLQNEIETKTAHGIAKTPFRSSPDASSDQTLEDLRAGSALGSAVASDAASVAVQAAVVVPGTVKLSPVYSDGAYM